MGKIKILKTESTQKDEIVKPLIGTVWHSYKQYKGYIIIDCCGGVKLQEGEYKTI